MPTSAALASPAAESGIDWSRVEGSGWTRHRNDEELFGALCAVGGFRGPQYRCLSGGKTTERLRASQGSTAG